MPSIDAITHRLRAKKEERDSAMDKIRTALNPYWRKRKMKRMLKRQGLTMRNPHYVRYAAYMNQGKHGEKPGPTMSRHMARIHGLRRDAEYEARIELYTWLRPS